MADIQRIYRLLVDSSQATRELQGVNKRLDGFSNGLNKLNSLAKKAFVGLATGFTLQRFTTELTSAIDEMDKFTKEAQRLGIATDELVKLNYAAELSGVSTEQLSTGVKTLSRSMNDLAQGNTSAAVKALDDLNISVQNSDRTLRSSTEVISDVADAFQAMPDGAEKSAIALNIFGKSGAQLIPLLNQGSEGIAAMGEEAEQLGLVFDNQAGKQAEQFNDNITRLKRIMDGVFRSIAEGLLPKLVSLTENFTKAANTGTNFRQVGEDIGKAVTIAGTAVGIATNIFQSGIIAIQGFGKVLGTLAAALVQVATTGDLRGAIKLTQESMRDIFAGVNKDILENNEQLIKQFEELAKQIQGVWVATIQKNSETTERGTDEQVSRLKIAFDNTVKDVGDAVQSMEGAVTDAFTEMVLNGKKSFSDLADSFIEAITRMVLQRQIIEPLFSDIDKLFNTTNAHGNIYDSRGLVPFAHGGIVSSPTLFPFANGIGLMAEAGPEAILPLSRDANGDLGVKGSATQVNIYNSSGAQANVTESTTADGGKRIDVMIENAVDKAIAAGRFDRSLNSVFSLRRRGN